MLAPFVRGQHLYLIFHTHVTQARSVYITHSQLRLTAHASAEKQSHLRNWSLGENVERC